MSYRKSVTLKSVKVEYTSGENWGEYRFLVSLNGQPTYEISTGDDAAADGSEWRNVQSLVPPSLFGNEIISDTDSVRVRCESWEFDGGLRFGDGYGVVENEFRLGTAVNQSVRINDNDGNRVIFNLDVRITEIPPEPEREPNLLGVRLYEDWKYNVDSPRTGGVFERARSQTFGVGQFNVAGGTTIPAASRPPRMRVNVRPDRTSSVKVGVKHFVTLFSEFDQQGERLVLNANTPEMPAGWNDRVRSISVEMYPMPR